MALKDQPLDDTFLLRETTMARLQFLLSLLLALAFLPPRLAAQDSVTVSMAEDFIRISGIEAVTKAQLNSMTATSLGIPAVDRYQDVFQAWQGKYFSWAVLHPRMITFVRTEFTPADLQTLIEFYHSPIGQKLVQARMDLGVTLASWMREQTQAHAQELMDSITVRSADSLHR